VLFLKARLFSFCESFFSSARLDGTRAHILLPSLLNKHSRRLCCWDFIMVQRSIRAVAFFFLASIAFATSSIGPHFAASAQQQPPAAAPTALTYMLGPNDRVRVKVYGESDITGEYEVDSTGQISVPLAGHVRAEGLTTKQLEHAIAAALAKGIVRDPRVNVEVALYRPYYILGEVKKGGEYPYRLGLTVLDAVASAGGFTYRANEGKVFLRRAGATAEEAYSLDAPVPVFPGDNIRIPERWF
jgi:polysaccharide biosynthesis/export protein